MTPDEDGHGRAPIPPGTDCAYPRRPVVAAAADPAQARARALRVRLLALDVDGTLTDGQLFIGPAGETMKAFSVRDGFGLTLLREAGVHLAIITARESAIVRARAAELQIGTVCQGIHDKAQALRALSRERGMTLDECAFVGDDWPDLAAMAIAGLAATAADAAPEVRASAHWISTLPAGHGAVRELAEFLLRARGGFDPALRRYRDAGSR